MTSRLFFLAACGSLALLICAVPHRGSAQSILSQRLDFEAQDQPIGEALLALSRASKTTIGFSEHIFERPLRVRVSAHDECLSAIMDRVLDGTGIGWKESGGQILLFKKTPSERTLCGFVEDANSGERLLGAFVMDLVSGRSVTSNDYGFFSLRVPGGQPAQLLISMLGFQLARLQVAPGPDRHIRLALQPATAHLSDLNVSSDSVEGRLRAFFPKKEENVVRMPIDRMAALGGETDIMQAAALLPGIGSSLDGLGGWSVRGGDVDQNLVMVDDAVVFSPSHGLGLLSVLNPDIVRSARLWKGDAPARLGGRASSILDVRTREGNMQRVAGSVSMGWMAARASLELPLAKNRGSLLLTARQSLAGPLLERSTRKSKSQQGWGGYSRYDFSDLNLKANWIFGPSNRLYLSFSQGRDRFSDQTEYNYIFADSASGSVYVSFKTIPSNNYRWQNRYGTLRWNHLYSDRCFSNTTITASQFFLRSVTSLRFEGSSDILFPPEDDLSTTSNTQLYDYTLRHDVDWFATERLTLRGGLQASLLRLLPFLYWGNSAQDTPDWVTVDSTGEAQASTRLPYERGLTLVAHGEAEWMPHPDWRLRAGLRAETFSSQQTTHFLPQPRLYAEHKWGKGWFASASWNATAQALRTVSPNVLESTHDLWLMASPALPPQRTTQWSAGLGWAGKGWALRAEAFVKKMRNVEEYHIRWFDGRDSTSSTWVDPSQLVEYDEGLRAWENEVALGKGRAWGTEVTLEKTAGRTTGWISWTAGRSERRFETLNEGKWFAARFDRAHYLKAVLLHRFGKHLSASGTVHLASGDAISRLVLHSADNTSSHLRLIQLHQGNLDSKRLGYGDFRQPTQHRLDLSATWAFDWGKTKHRICVGAYNAYNRSNTHFTYWQPSAQWGLPPLKKNVKGLPLLPHLSWGMRF
ncbi:MAG TPA: TonB-dependent receptor plug domain-containing protein [Saprospiraceae bacterium]|nr:TonB-dependent receptor plug domain-containing protein [Saprospiraceae bacterium]